MILIGFNMWRILLLALAVAPAVLGDGGDCSIKITANDKFYGVYFKIFRLSRPKHNLGSVRKVKNGSTVQFTCGTGFVKDELVGNSYVFQCTDGKFNKTLEFEDLVCRSSYHKNTQIVPISSIEFGSKIFKCNKNGWEAYKVLVRQRGGKSKHIYTTCFDKTTMRAKFVFQPTRNESPERSNSSRNDVWGIDRFGSDIYMKVRLTEGYSVKIQKERITKAFPEKYDSRNPYPYEFHRGHLAPYADFIDESDKYATCLYLNVAPQWKEFNSHSWSLVEHQTRYMVKYSPADWEIYTGTYSSIPTSKGPLFVSPFFDKNGKYVKSYVPVPRLYWKVVYNVKEKSKSKVFVGVNNPELKSTKQFTEKYLICKPIPDKYGNKFKGNEFKGFIYECDLDEFLKKLKSMENIVK